MGFRPTRETPNGAAGRQFVEGYGCLAVDMPPSMERLLVPTKCWAKKIGITTTPDLREQRTLNYEDSLSQQASSTARQGRLSTAKSPSGLRALSARRIHRDRPLSGVPAG